MNDSEKEGDGELNNTEWGLDLKILDFSWKMEVEIAN